MLSHSAHGAAAPSGVGLARHWLAHGAEALPMRFCRKVAVRFQKGRELAIVGKFMSEPSRDVGCRRQVTLPDLHVPQRKLSFDMTEEL